VKRFTPEELAPFELMTKSMVLDRDIGEFRRVIERVGFLKPGMDVSDEAIGEYFGHFYDFILEDRPVTMTQEFASETVRRFFDPTGEHGDIMRAANVPKAMVIIQRINLGLYAVLAELGATANWRKLAEEIWPWIAAAPHTELGRLDAEWRAARQVAEPAS
jgi:hypothetical protein